MAISATFRADFQQFSAAVNQAQTQLRSFQSGAGQVEKALTRIGDSFSGRKVLSEATLAVKAVNDLGGVTKLTEAEQKRLNATVTEAIAKYKALGQQAPKDMVAIQTATKQAETATSGLGLSLAGVGKSILTTAAGFVTAQAAFSAVKFAVTGLVSELKTITLHGATVADVAENFEHLTNESGRLGSTLLGELRAGTHGTISDFDLMKTATQDLAAGLNLTDQQFGTLAQGAFALAQATGGDVATALETMNDAMLTGRTRSLALLTGKIDLEKAETAFAKSLGATREQLSEEGKLEAARVAILDSVGGAIARLGVQTDGLDEKVAQARAQWVNFENELGRLVATSPVIMAGLDGISEALTQAFGAEKGNLVRAIADLIDDAAIALANFAKVAVTSAGFLVTEYYAIYKLFGNVRQIIDGVTVATLYLGKAQLALPNAIGIGTEAYRKNDEAIQRLMVTMVARGKALKDTDQAQANVNTTSGTYIKTLDQMVASMEAARGTQGTLATGAASASTALGAVGTAAGAAGAKVTGATGAFLSGDKAAKALAKSTKELADEQQRFIELTESESLKGWLTELERVDELADRDRQALFDMNLEIDRQNEDMARLSQSYEEYEMTLSQSGAVELWQLQTAAAKEYQKVLSDINNQAGLKQMAKDAGVSIEDLVPKNWGGVFEGLKDAGRSALGDLNNIFRSAFEGGGGIGGAVKSLATNLASSLLSLVPMVGPILSQFAGAIVAGLSKIGNLFGLGKSEGRRQLEEANAEIRILQDQLLKTHGSLDNIRNMAGEAGQELAAAWGSQNREGLEHFRRLLGDFNDELERQQRITGVVDDLLGTQFFEDMQDLQEAFASLTPEQLSNDIILERLVKRYLSLQEETGQVIPGLQELADMWMANANAAKIATGTIYDSTGAMRDMATQIQNVHTQVDKIDWPEKEGFTPPTQAEIDEFLRNNPGDVHRIPEAFTNTPGQSLTNGARQASSAIQQTTASAEGLETQVTSFQQTSGVAFGQATTANDGFRASVTTSDTALQQLGQTQATVTEAMIAGFDRVIATLDAMIARLGTAATMLASTLQDAGPIGGERASGGETAKLYIEPVITESGFTRVARGLFNAFTDGDTKADFDEAQPLIRKFFGDAKLNIDTLAPAINGVAEANDDFTLSLTDSDDAMYRLGRTQLTVTETMWLGFERLIGKLDELIERLGTAISLTSTLQDTPTVGQRLGELIGGERGSGGETAQMYGEPIPMASGGYGRVTKPTLFLAGEAGSEDVAFSGANKRFGGNSEVSISIAPGAIVVQGAQDPQAVAQQVAVRLVDEIRRNFKGTRTDMRVALGVA